MKKVILVFPDHSALRQFIWNQQLSIPNIRPRQVELISDLSDQQIVNACTYHQAIIKRNLTSPVLQNKTL